MGSQKKVPAPRPFGSSHTASFVPRMDASIDAWSVVSTAYSPITSPNVAFGKASMTALSVSLQALGPPWYST